MYGTLAMVHNAVAWLVLGVGAFVVVRGATGRATWGAGDRAWVKRLVLLVHLQLVAGLVLWFVSPAVQAARASMGTTMKDAGLRRLVVEHPTLMIAAVVVATIMGARVKRGATPEGQARTALVGAAVTLLLVAAMVPWDRLVGRWTGG
jgi:uncharacterized membrane protein